MQPGYEKILSEYESLTAEMATAGADLAKLGRRQAQLAPVVGKLRQLQSLSDELADNQAMLDDQDAALRSLALDECRRLEQAILQLQEEIDESLLPKDPNDGRDAIVEIRAGAGGDEATLFAAELFRAYGKYAGEHRLATHIVSASRSEAGGFKEVIFEISAPGPARAAAGPYGLFRFESGVHRVQRVPQTEKSGRVHTSTVTVAVLPLVEEQDFSIADKDLKIEATTSSGHGGQSVNTTYSAVRIVHLPTGITAQCQDERSFAQNKEKALEVIRARVASHYREIEEKKIRDLTKSQIGTGDRSEKIRTYNFPQDRVTDHRINENFSQISLIMEGKLDNIFNALQKADISLKKQALKK